MSTIRLINFFDNENFKQNVAWFSLIGLGYIAKLSNYGKWHFLKDEFKIKFDASIKINRINLQLLK